MPRDIHYCTKNWVHKNGTITIFFRVITLRPPLNCNYHGKIVTTSMLKITMPVQSQFMWPS